MSRRSTQCAGKKMVVKQNHHHNPCNGRLGGILVFFFLFQKRAGEWRVWLAVSEFLLFPESFFLPKGTTDPQYARQKGPLTGSMLNIFLGGLNLTVLYTSPNRSRYGVGSKARGGQRLPWRICTRGERGLFRRGANDHTSFSPRSVTLYRFAAPGCGHRGGGVHAPLGGVLSRGPHRGRRQGVGLPPPTLLISFRKCNSSNRPYSFFVHLRSYVVRTFRVQRESVLIPYFIHCFSQLRFSPIYFLST